MSDSTALWVIHNFKVDLWRKIAYLKLYLSSNMNKVYLLNKFLGGRKAFFSLCQCIEPFSNVRVPRHLVLWFRGSKPDIPTTNLNLQFNNECMVVKWHHNLAGFDLRAWNCSQHRDSWYSSSDFDWSSGYIVHTCYLKYWSKDLNVWTIVSNILTWS